MASRAHQDNPLWVLCCCGGLPILGALKALLFFAPPTVYTTLAATATALIFLPKNVYLITKLSYTTVLFGRNLRLLLLVLLPFAAIAWLPIVLFSSFVGSFCWNLGSIACSIFDKSVPFLTGGVWDVYEGNHKFIREFWKNCSEEIIIFVADRSYIPRGWNGQVYEIPLFKVFVGFILAIYGSIIGFLLASVIVVVKFLPVLIRTNIHCLKSPPKCHWIPFWIIGCILLNVFSPFVAVLVILGGLFCGVACAMEALKSDCISSGFWEVFRWMRRLDMCTTEFILDTSDDQVVSCIPEPPSRPSEKHSSSSGTIVELTSNTLEQVYSNFLVRCRDMAWTAVEKGEIKREHLTDVEPFVILGIPAAALFDILITDKENMTNNTTITCSAMTVKRTDLAQHNGIVRVFWPKIMAVRRAIVAQKLSAADIEYMRFHLITGAAPEEEMTGQARETKKAMENNSTNTAKLNGLVSSLNSFSIDASRLRFMLDRFQTQVLVVPV